METRQKKVKAWGKAELAVALLELKPGETSRHLVAVTGEGDEGDVMIFPENLQRLGFRVAGGQMRKEILIHMGRIEDDSVQDEEEDQGEQL